ncbi:MAG: glycosyltransferase [Rhodospirillales bacterium]|nr:glycosyltransferase [Rhodospirillales bacterium]
MVLKGYPRLSETFIAQEIHALEQRGLDIRLISLRHPTDKRRHPVHDEISAPVNYLPEYLGDEPARVLHGWRAARKKPGFGRALRVWLRDLVRDPTRNRVRRFGQALVLAMELPPDTSQIHAHFMHTPASVARYASMICQVPWSCSAHAKDIWTSPEWEKREKLADCDWLVTCTAVNAEHLAGLALHPEKVLLAYHGLDFGRFACPAHNRPPRDGSDADDPVTLLSVGRAVNKKGFDVLLQALAEIPPGLQWRYIHIGGGEDLETLKRQAADLSLNERISWLGALPQEEVLANYRGADLFVLPCRISANGDRDGLPNVLMEAQSQGLACVSTDVSAIPELIANGVTGILVPPEDRQALAHALAGLIAHPPDRVRLGKAGLENVRAGFGMEAGLDKLAAAFGLEDQD